MKLQEIFDQLTYGELSQISMGGGEAGVINSANYDRVLAHISLGLTALHKRFPLKESRLTLQLVPGRTTYPIQSKYAVNSATSDEEVRFILDSEDEPFADDILKIEQVLTSDGVELFLNDSSKEYAVMTPSATVIRVPADIVAQGDSLPDELKTETLELVYRANHAILKTDEGDLEPEEVEVELPYSHLEPLLLFVAARVHTPMGAANEGASGNNYMAKYEMACKELETQNLRVDQGGQYNRLRNGGWV